MVSRRWWPSSDAVIRAWQTILALKILVLLSSCAVNTHNSNELSWARDIHPYSIAKTGSRTSARLSVLTYNVAGLPWPISSGRRQALHAIAQEIALMVEQGQGPDVILIQEGFVSETSAIGRQAGFIEHVAGPSAQHRNAQRFDLSNPITASLSQALPRRWWKGEGVGPLVGSGLHVFSRYPIAGVRRMSFGDACAGYDCLANKGALSVRILVPGMPDPLELMTTHLNSTNSAGVGKAETDAAHLRQVKYLTQFWQDRPDSQVPIIIGGDFNIRGAQGRFVQLAKHFSSLTFVQDTCSAFGGACHCEIDFETHSPWLHSQDVQAFKSGRRVSIHPLEARHIFDAGDNGQALSDHAGYLVTYELRWRSAASINVAHR